MFTIPPKGHDARRYLPDAAGLAEILNLKNAGRLPFLATANNNACVILNNNPAIVAVTTICINRLSGERWLVRFGEWCHTAEGWGEYDVLWNFGTGEM